MRDEEAGIRSDRRLVPQARACHHSGIYPNRRETGAILSTNHKEIQLYAVVATHTGNPSEAPSTDSHQQPSPSDRLQSRETDQRLTVSTVESGTSRQSSKYSNWKLADSSIGNSYA